MRTVYCRLSLVTGYWSLVILAATLLPSCARRAPKSQPPRRSTPRPALRTPQSLRPELALQIMHIGPVRAVAFSPDGKTVATASEDKTVKLWDMQTGEFKRTLKGHKDVVNSVTFSPDGKIVASGCNDDKTRLWDVQTGALKRTLTGHYLGANSVAFWPDGKTVASVRDIHKGSNLSIEVRLWDAQTGRVQRMLTLTGHSKSIYSVALSPDGKAIATGGWREEGGKVIGEVKLWDAQTGKAKRTLTGHSDRVYSVAFSPNGKTLVSASWDKTVRVWDAETGRLKRTLTGHTDALWAVAFSPDGKTLASGGRDMTVRLWDARTGALKRTLKRHSNNVLTVAFSADGKTVASGSWDSTAILWDVATGELKRTLGKSVPVRAVAFSPDGKTVASGSQDGAVRFWDRQTGALMRTLTGHSDAVRSVAFSPDGKTLASGSRDGTIRLWDAQTGVGNGRRAVPQRTLTGHGGRVYSVAFSPDGKRLVSGGYDGAARLWDAQTGKLKQALVGHRGYVFSVAFSPDGKTLASGSGEEETSTGEVKLWDAQTGKLKRTLKGHKNTVLSVAFSPDGKTLASGSFDFTLRLWDVQTGKSKQTLGTGVPSSIFDVAWSVAFSPDGKTLACGNDNKQMVLWDVSTGSAQSEQSVKLRQRLEGYSHGVYAIAFSPDGKTLVGGSGDTTVRLWDVRRGRLLATIFTPVPDDSMKPINGRSKSRAPQVMPSDDYLVLTPEGYYSGSPGADRFVRFQLRDALFPAECFQARYYRPDLVKQSLEGKDLPPVGAFKGPYPPRLAFTAPKNGAKVTAERINLQFKATDDSEATQVMCFVNGIRVETKPVPARSSADTKTRTFTGRIILPSDPTIKLQAIAFDDDGLQSPRVERVITRANPPAEVKGKLWGLCVGVSRYVDADLNLRYADRDATALAKRLNQQRGIYREAKVESLTNEQATREKVQAALAELSSRVKREDTVVLFFAGHGWQIEERHFYFATHEFNRQNVAGTALPWEDVAKRLVELLGRSRRVIVLLDTCYSGSAAKNDELVTAILNPAKTVLIFASSRRNEFSIEKTDWQHGAFTQALLEALSGQAAPKNRNDVPLRKFVDYVQDRVAELTNDAQHPQVPFLYGFDTDAPIVTKP